MLSLPWREEALSNQFWLSAAQFTRLQPLLPTATRGVPRVAARRVLSGIVQVLQSGWRWRAAPPVYGPSTRRCTIGSSAGRAKVSGKACSCGGPRPAGRPRRCCWMRRRSRHIGPRRAEKGGAAAGDRAGAGRPNDQNPCRRRCGRAPPAADPRPRPSWGYPGRDGPGGRPDAGPLPGRYRLRQRCAPRLAVAPGLPAGHPQQPDPRAQTSLRQNRLSGAQRHRAHLLPAQGLAPSCHPLRQTRPQLPCHRRPRCSRPLLVMSPDPRGC